MILYNNAFDLYHTIFRMLHLLSKIEEDKVIEIDRIRIWDYYLLFTNEIFNIKPTKNKKELIHIFSWISSFYISI